MENEVALLLEKLEAIYQRVVKSPTPKLFFLSLVEYIDLYDKNPILRPIWEKIVALEEKDLKELKNLEEKSYEEIRRAFRKIKKYVSEKNIKIPEVIDHLKRFEECEKGTLESSLGPLKEEYSNISYVLMSLVEAKNPDYLKFCRQYGKITDEYRIKEWFFSPSYNRWEELTKEIDRKKLTKVWYSWDNLVLFYDLFQNYERKQKKNLKEDKFLDVWTLSMLFQEIKDILEERTQSATKIRHFKHEDYLLHLERVHLFTKEAIKKETKKSHIQKKKQNWAYILKTGIFYINNKPVQFKKNSLRAKILELITKNEENKRKTWDWNELYETIEKTEVGKEYQNKVYYACRGINEYIASKTGATDFLIVTTKSICINPCYLS